MSRFNRDQVLEALESRGPRAMHHGEVCSRLDAKGAARDRVLDLLEELVSLGLAKQLPGRRFRAVKKAAVPIPSPAAATRASEPLEGRLTMHPSGFGFVLADDGGPDVFIPPPSVGAALHADRVRVMARPSPKGREGRILEVVARGVRRIGGVLRRAGGNTWIDPDDPRMRGPMPVVGNVPDEARPGLQVAADIVKYPRFSDEMPEVEIIDVLGKQGVTEVEVMKLKLRDGVVEEFPPQVLAEADGIPSAVTKAERKGRLDLRDRDLVTIDPDDARDHDDAVWAERTDDGGYHVIVAIADVSHYVREGTAIDTEALARGCSIYLPDRAIPMLPPALSSHLASLVPHKDRLCMAVECTLAPTGAVTKYEFHEALMRSGARLTYGGVARALGWTSAPAVQPEAEQRLDMLRVLDDVSRILRQRRTKRGSLNFDLPEPKVVLEQKTGEPVSITRQKGDPGVKRAYSVIEELMLLANEVVAEDLARRAVPSVYRVHGNPDEDKLLKFCELAAALGEKIDPEEALDPKKLSRFLRRIEKKPHAGPLNYLLLRAMQQAIYDTQNVGHFALAAKYYTHFTSPIRRYPDLCVHRVLRAMLRGDERDHTEQRKQLKHASLESSRLERRAIELERDVIDLYRAVIMRDRVGEDFEATVSGIAGHGFYSSFDTPYVDAVSPLDMLDDFFEPDELGVRLSGRRTKRTFALGDRVKLRVVSVSIERREIIALPIEDAERQARAREAGEPYGERERDERPRGQRGQRASGRPSSRPTSRPSHRKGDRPGDRRKRRGDRSRRGRGGGKRR
jgi:ribonuclease R